MTAAEKAEAASKEIERLHAAYRTALRVLNGCKVTDAPIRLPLIREVWDKATSLYNAVEQAIVQTDLLKLHESEVWATDLAATACNVLESLPEFYTKMRKEYASVGASCPQPSSLAYYSMQGVAPLYHPETSKKLRKEFERAKLPTSGFTHPHKMTPRFSNTERWTGIVTAIVLVVFMLIIAVVFDEKRYNGFNLWVFRIVTSLAVGILGGAFVPGLFNVTHTVGKTVVRAAGGCAFFAVAYFVNPPALVLQDIRVTTGAESAPATPKK